MMDRTTSIKLPVSRLIPGDVIDLHELPEHIFVNLGVGVRAVMGYELAVVEEIDVEAADGRGQPERIAVYTDQGGYALPADHLFTWQANCIRPAEREARPGGPLPGE